MRVARFRQDRFRRPRTSPSRRRDIPSDTCSTAGVSGTAASPYLDVAASKDRIVRVDKARSFPRIAGRLSRLPRFFRGYVIYYDTAARGGLDEAPRTRAGRIARALWPTSRPWRE